jgi:hypothetical protein
MLFIDVGSCSTSVTSDVKVQNELNEFHFNRATCRPSAGVSYTYSESFFFNVSPSKRVVLSATQALPSTAAAVSLLAVNFYK